ARCKQQSKPAASELRHTEVEGNQSRYSAEALLRTSDIEKRKPLAPTARRAGWVGSNILLNRIPSSGKIHVVKDGIIQPTEVVLAAWRRTLFLREQPSEMRGWLIEVMKCVEALGRQEFELADVYAFEARLSALYPNYRHVKQKIRQQLQVLRDRGYLEFLSRGRYRVISPSIS